MRPAELTRNWRLRAVCAAAVFLLLMGGSWAPVAEDFRIQSVVDEEEGSFTAYLNNGTAGLITITPVEAQQHTDLASTAIHPSGGYVTCGTFAGKQFEWAGVDIPAPTRDVIIGRILSDGTENWLKSSTQQSDGAWCRDISIHDGRILVSGGSMSSIVLGSHSSSEDRTTAFVGELSLNGQWLWAETVHGTSHRDWILAQSSVSDDSNVWLAGDYQWNIQFGGINVSSSDQILSSEGFIGMYNRTSSSWTEVATLNGGYYDFIRDIKLFPNGDALVVGGFCGLGPTSEGCNATTGQHNLSSVGAGDVFVGRLKTDGTWAWVRTGGSQGEDNANGADVDEDGNVVIAGYYSGPFSFGNLSLQAPVGAEDGFVMKLTGGGDPVWLNSAGSIDADLFAGVSFDEDGHVAIVGYGCAIYYPTSCSITAGSRSANSTDVDQAILAWADTDDGEWLDIHLAGGSGWDIAKDVRIDNHHVIVTGKTLCDDALPTPSCTAQFGQFNHSVNSQGEQGFIWRAQLDQDRDGIPNWQDVCPEVYDPNQADSDEDGIGDACDGDYDDDGVPDDEDACLLFTASWISNSTTDFDGDGCRDADQDFDDDDDGRVDAEDRCPRGEMNWTASNSTDHDADGCRDDGEDLDDDDDAWIDDEDACPRGLLDWFPSLAYDWDQDGCEDFTEDDDDDNDGIFDESDACARGLRNWSSTLSTDLDRDGCHDSEDIDQDGDGVIDTYDACPRGQQNWTSSLLTDLDWDGCRDADEDGDDDGDGILDEDDDCPLEAGNSWQDQMGCFDNDHDGYADSIDAFPNDDTQWNDTDGDGFGDNWHDVTWQAQRNSTWPGKWVENATNSDRYPLDASIWSDTDNDGFPDQVSSFHQTDDCPNEWGLSDRGDRAGCPDSDSDGWADLIDHFPSEPTQYLDHDRDGFGDNQDGAQPDSCPTTPGSSSMNSTLGCPDADGDGWADSQDKFPSEQSQWADRDGDGLGDNTLGVEADACPSEPGPIDVEPRGCPIKNSSAEANSINSGLWVLLLLSISIGLLVLTRSRPEFQPEGASEEDAMWADPPAKPE